MLVLGITDGITCGAAVLRDGGILAAINEERLSRLKMAYGFPRRSIAESMRLAGVSTSEVDRVAVATTNNYFFDGVRPFDGWFTKDKGFLRDAVFSTVGGLSGLLDSLPWLESLYYKARWPIFAARRRAIRRIVRDEFGINAPVEFMDHHLAHAASAYFTSGFEDALVVTMDGGGDGASSHAYVVRDGAFERVGTTSAFNSLGNYYAYVTHICGYKAQKHEGKITGLAAHGQPVYRDMLDSLITFRDGEIRNVGKLLFTAALKGIRRRLPAGWKQEDLAASIQKHSEALAVSNVRHHLREGRPRKVALAGGLFANVRINQMIYEAPGVEEVFVHPGMTDCGLAVGAALVPCIRRPGGMSAPWRREVLPDVYSGPEYSSREVQREVEASGLRYERPPSIEKEVARLLAEGYVVARFNGRMEYGPRALGNRSILYHAADRSINDWLNKRLERTEFMPFAPSTLMERAGDHYLRHVGARETARFMTITLDCTPRMKETCPGVVHIDGTARPQLVSARDNPSYHAIISEFERLTGYSTIINTSFNMHEEPIVCSPGDAVRSFCAGRLDFLAIGDFLVPSPRPIDRQPAPPPRLACEGMQPAICTERTA